LAKIVQPAHCARPRSVRSCYSPPWLKHVRKTFNDYYRTLAALLLGAALAACGTTPATLAPPQPPTRLSVPAAAALPTAVQPTIAPQATALSDPADSLQVLETTAEYRLIRHARGETKVPLQPSCIIVAGSGYLDHLLTQLPNARSHCP
jgi:hypothetical protein